MTKEPLCPVLIWNSELLSKSIILKHEFLLSHKIIYFLFHSKKLDSLTPNIKAIVGDEMKGYMINGDAAIGVTFSGEASEMLDSNEHLHYVVPSEGSNLWFDNLVIPKTAKHIKEAYAFINFMLKPENAAQNAEYIGYATPNNEAKKLLPDDIKNDKAFYPSTETFKNLEVYDNLGQKWLGIYNDLYLQFKMYRK